MPKAPIKVAVTGAAGQIGYALLFRIASGAMFGPDQPVILQLIEAPFEKPLAALAGVAMSATGQQVPLHRFTNMVPMQGATGAFDELPMLAGVLASNRVHLDTAFQRVMASGRRRVGFIGQRWPSSMADRTSASVS